MLWIKQNSKSYTIISFPSICASCTTKQLISKRSPNFLFSFASSAYFGAFIKMLTKTSSNVSSTLNVACPPKAMLVPTTTKMLTIPIGIQLLSVAINIAIPKGASSLFAPKLTKESKKDTRYTIPNCLFKHFCSTCFMLIFLFNSTSS